MDWTRGQTIGRGTSATVYIATAKGSDQLFAVKSAELSKSEYLKREQRILSTLKTCPQIVAYKGCDITLENGTLFYNMFMEYAMNGTVVDVIHKHNGGLVESLVRTMTRQILLGLHHLHSNGIVHCDIKGKNILVSDEGIKIADLGCARVVDDVSSSKRLIAGTPAFMAPEVARGEEQGLPADVWALGCTVIEMVTGRAPWTDITDPISALFRIGYLGEVPEIPSCMSKHGRDFLSRCLASDPNDRWSTSELLKHEFVQESNWVWEETDFSNSDTPTGVLYRAIWDSSDELETSSDPTHYVNWNSPLDRIRSLGFCQEAATSFPSDDNWECSDHWVTVRSNEMEVPELQINEDINPATAENCDSENPNLASEDHNAIPVDEAPIHIQLLNGVKHNASIIIIIISSSSSNGITRSYANCRNILLVCRPCRKEIVRIAGLEFECKHNDGSTLFISPSSHHLPVCLPIGSHDLMLLLYSLRAYHTKVLANYIFLFTSPHFLKISFIFFPL